MSSTIQKNIKNLFFPETAHETVKAVSGKN
jgi:hypothetical protein